MHSTEKIMYTEVGFNYLTSSIIRDILKSLTICMRLTDRIELAEELCTSDLYLSQIHHMPLNSTDHSSLGISCTKAVWNVITLICYVGP